MRRPLFSPQRRAPFFAALLTMSTLPAVLTGCGGGAAAGDVAGGTLSAGSLVTQETLGAVEDILSAVVRSPTRASEQTVTLPDGTCTESYLSFENGYEAVVRRTVGTETIEGRISGPGAGLPASYRIQGDTADVRYTDGTTQRVTLR